MAEISAADVMKLRNITGAQMMACKQALIAANGDMDKAIEELRKKFKDVSAKAAERETAEGRVGVYIDADKQVGAIIEVRCETAPVAKNEMFVKLVNELARQVALKGAATPEDLLKQPWLDDAKHTVQDKITDLVGLMRENMKPARLTRLTGHLGGYVHHDGTVGVLVQAEGARADAPALRDVAMHVAARSPMAALREHVGAGVIAKEKEIAQAQIQADPKNKSKPPQVLEMIAEGKMKTWFAENVLHDQPFVKDDSKTVGELLKGVGLKLAKFVRYKVGEKS
jgi:elongation factor Ts